MTAVVINKCHGGFGLSKGAMEEYKRRAGTDEDTYDWDIARDDPHLVAIVEEMGEDAGGRFSELKVVRIPDGVGWTIEEYDGLEWVAEVHRKWS